MMNPIDYKAINDKRNPTGIKEWAKMLLEYFFHGIIWGMRK